MKEERKALKPLDVVSGFLVRPGFYEVYGATALEGAVNFTVHSQGASSCELLLYHRKEEEPYAVLRFPDHYKIGQVYSMIVFGLDIEEFEYAYRLDGPWDPKKGLPWISRNLSTPTGWTAPGTRKKGCCSTGSMCFWTLTPEP